DGVIEVAGLNSFLGAGEAILGDALLLDRRWGNGRRTVGHGSVSSGNIGGAGSRTSTADMVVPHSSNARKKRAFYPFFAFDLRERMVRGAVGLSEGDGPTSGNRALASASSRNRCWLRTGASPAAGVTRRYDPSGSSSRAFTLSARVILRISSMSRAFKSGCSTGKITSTRRLRLRSIQSALPVNTSG